MRKKKRSGPKPQWSQFPQPLQGLEVLLNLLNPGFGAFAEVGGEGGIKFLVFREEEHSPRSIQFGADEPSGFFRSTRRSKV